MKNPSMKRLYQLATEYGVLRLSEYGTNFNMKDINSFLTFVFVKQSESKFRKVSDDK